MALALLTGDLLDQLAAPWRDQHAPITALLRPGLTDEEIDATTAPAGIRLPEEARRREPSSEIRTRGRLNPVRTDAPLAPSLRRSQR
jgi:hypothetical protein